jgi:hypothetical protein
MKLTALRPAYAVPGPVASVELDASRTTEDAAHLLDLRWRALRDQLGRDGADAATLSALDEAAVADHGVAGEHGRALFAADGRLLLDTVLPLVPGRDSATWAALPHARALARQRAENVAHVVVFASRTGADLEASAFGYDVARRVESHPHDPHLRKVKGGDWAQLKYHHHAENIWTESARDVARQVDQLVMTTDAEVLAIAGDVRARELLLGELGQRSASIAVSLAEGGRAEGADGQGVRRRVSQLCAEVAARAELAAVDRWSAAGDAAVSGLGPVIAALARGQVETLLLWDGAEPPAVWVGEQAQQLGVVPGDILSLGGSEPVEVNGADALLRAVAATDADVTFVPTGEPPGDGVAAVLRYTSP